jgi:quinol monooxygenase YgiN
MQILYRVRIKEVSVDAFNKLLNDILIPEALKLPGCNLFSVYQDMSDSRGYILYESWDDEASIHTYKKNLIRILGNPHPGEEFPAQMNDMIEDDEDLL